MLRRCGVFSGEMLRRGRADLGWVLLRRGVDADELQRRRRGDAG